MGNRLKAYILVIVSLMISVSMISCTPTKITPIQSPAASEAKEEVSVEAIPTAVEKRPAEETRQPEAVIGQRLKRETAKLVTYGLDTPAKEGDDDHENTQTRPAGRGYFQCRPCSPRGLSGGWREALYRRVCGRCEWLCR